MGVGKTHKSNLTRGASIMVVCVAIAKFLGVVWIIPVTTLIGNEGLGIYSNAYAMYNILLTLATSGFPLAMGKLVSERLAHKQYGEVEQMYRVTMRVVTLFGIAAFLLMWFGAPLYSTVIAVLAPGKASSQMVLSIRALAPSLLVVPIMSALRGYLQGFQQLEAPAYSQAVEQLFRVIAMVIGAYIVVHAGMGVVAGAAAATFGAFVGAVAGLCLLVAAVIPVRRQFRHQGQGTSRLSNRQILRMMYRVALPVSLGTLVVPISNLADSLTVQNFLMIAGKTLREATIDYGILSRQALYLIQLPLSFAFAIGVSVLPAISEAVALKRQPTIQSHVTGTFRTMFFITFPTAAVLLVLANPIDYVLSHSYQGAPIISAVSFMCVFSSLELISTYILQGLGKMYRPVRNMFLGVFVKVLLNVVLITLMHSVMGAAIATTIGYLFSSILNVLAVRKYGRVRFSMPKLAMPFLLPTVPLCVVLYVVNALVHKLLGASLRHHLWMQNLVQFIVASACGAIFYIYLAIRIGSVRPEELSQLPSIGRRLSAFARRIQKPRNRQAL